MHINLKTNLIAFINMVLLPVVSYASGDPGIKFIENKGQWRDQVFYSAALPGGSVFLQKDRLTYSFYDAEFLHKRHTAPTIEKKVADENECPTGGIADSDYIDKHAFEVIFKGSSAAVDVQHMNAYSIAHNYYRGSDPGRWITGAKAYETILYNDLYECIDLKIYSGEHLKYDIVAKPGSDLNAVRLQYKGLEQIFVKSGNLHLITSLNEIVEQAPYAFQIIRGDTIEVDAEFILNGNEEVTFGFPEGYDKKFPLIIDPLLVFASFSGSEADNFGYTATFDANGNLYSGGIVYGQGFPVTTGAYQEAYNGGEIDIGILKFDSTGSNLLYATYLGGSSDEAPHSMIVDNNGDLIILGSTSSKDFATTANAYDRSFNGGSPQPNLLGYLPYTNGVDLFLTKLSAAGGGLVGSTYIGGTDDDGVILTNDRLRQNYGDEFRGDVTVDGDNFIYVASATRSGDFFKDASIGFVTVDTTLSGISDAVVFKIDQNLSALSWGRFLGGGGEDAAFSIKTGFDKSVYVAGGTLASGESFPTTSGALNESSVGGIDGFVSVIKSDGTALVSSTLIGTPEYDQAYFLDLDADENIYLFGQTRGNYTITPGVYSVPNSGQFIHKINNNLTATMFSTVFGSGTREPNISPTAFLVNDCDNLYVSGWGGVVNRGYSTNNGSTDGMHTTQDAFKSQTDGSDIYLMSLTSNGNELLYATFFGGSNNGGDHVDGGTNRFDKRGIIYQAVCSCGGQPDDFPVTPGAYAEVNLGVNRDGVQRCNNAVFKFDMASLRARIQTNSLTFDQPGINSICLPDPVVFQNISVGGELYEWDFGDGTEITRIDTTHVIHQYQDPGNYLVKLRAIDPTTCIGEDITTVTISIHQPSFTVSDDVEICFGDSFKLNASGGVDYYWVSNDSTFTSNQRAPMVSPQDTTSYFVAITDVNGCTVTDTVEVAVVPALDLEFNVLKLHDCFSRPAIKFINSSKEGESFQWILGDGNTATGQELIYKYKEDGIYNVTLAGSRNFCVFEKQVELKVKTVKVFNVITPAMADHNDTFEIVSGSKVELKIFNRWGKLIFQENDYQNDWNGEKQVSGTYYYQADIEDEVICKGWLHLIK